MLCIFFAFLLQPVFYSGMIFFITVMLGQLYTLLGTFSDELLALRLLETAGGGDRNSGIPAGPSSAQQSKPV